MEETLVPLQEIDNFEWYYLEDMDLSKLPIALESMKEDISSFIKLENPEVEWLFRQLFKHTCNVRSIFTPILDKKLYRLYKRIDQIEVYNRYKYIKDFFISYAKKISNDKLQDLRLENALAVCKNFSFDTRQISRLRKKSESVGHFPVLLAISIMIDTAEPKVKDYIYNHSCAIKGSMPVSEKQLEENSHLNGKFIYRYNKFLKSLKPYIIKERRIYRKLSWSEINAQEGTKFSQNFINYFLYKSCDAWYVGDPYSWTKISTGRDVYYPNMKYVNHNVDCFVRFLDKIYMASDMEYVESVDIQDFYPDEPNWCMCMLFIDGWGISYNGEKTGQTDANKQAFFYNRRGVGLRPVPEDELQECFNISKFYFPEATLNGTVLHLKNSH